MASDLERFIHHKPAKVAYQATGHLSSVWTGAAEPILAQVCGYVSPRREAALLGMLQAYCDESGKGAGPVFVIAGYVASAERWANFSTAWREELDRTPYIKILKTAKAYALQGDFYQWREDARDAKLTRLAEVIRDHVLFGVHVVFHTDAYKKVMRGKIARTTDNPFFFAYMAAQISAARYMQEFNITDGPAAFTFDEVSKGEAAPIVEAHYSFAELAPADMKPYASTRTPTFDSDEVVLPLQAADMFAWHIRRLYAGKFGGNIPDSQVTKILGSIPSREDVWDENRLINTLNIGYRNNAAAGKRFLYEEYSDGRKPRK